VPFSRCRNTSCSPPCRTSSQRPRSNRDTTFVRFVSIVAIALCRAYAYIGAKHACLKSPSARAPGHAWWRVDAACASSMSKSGPRQARAADWRKLGDTIRNSRNRTVGRRISSRSLGRCVSCRRFQATAAGAGVRRLRKQCGGKEHRNLRAKPARKELRSEGCSEAQRCARQIA
jgi:hypothetical protein